MGANGERLKGKCQVCRIAFTWCDGQGKTCSNKCRQQAYRDRKKIAPIVKAMEDSLARSAKTAQEALQQFGNQ